MENAFRILEDIIADIFLEQNYIFQPKAEFEECYSFILVIEDIPANSDLIKEEQIKKIIQEALNLEISVLSKPVEIEIEVFNEVD